MVCTHCFCEYFKDADHRVITEIFQNPIQLNLHSQTYQIWCSIAIVKGSTPASNLSSLAADMMCFCIA
ncbi:hypothetical protein I7I53_07401 [Histoplasma capsulatum var. duboisii H88]|uniref:Uncharacterized protein n=1 Tax=Ajellomyces capsulatus (strain H88) TaxID=544711 RepID=A0A8A1LJF0_AJEC8|nr:hypothetical protein I7I53_07401 [Histoplasma capsulatum var. duboisii H88]